MGENQYIVPQGSGWTIKGEGNQRVTGSHETQADGLGAAREIAQHRGSEIIIHWRDDHIRDRESYGKGPHSSRDRKTED